MRPRASRAARAAVRGPGKTAVRLNVNGETYTVGVEPRQTLLDALRIDLGLTGAKPVCEMGDCGACTVILDGKAIYACLALAIECEDREILTIEGLARPGVGAVREPPLHPIQQAFVEEDALQCGFCTPGQILAVKALLDRNLAPTADEVRQAIAGNLCRCGAYPAIVRAALSAAAKLRERSAEC